MPGKTSRGKFKKDVEQIILFSSFIKGDPRQSLSRT